jgi:hypothetical protein
MDYSTKATVFGLNLRGGTDTLDNGVGFMGANTRDPNLVGFSIPVEAFVQKYGGITKGKNIIREQGAPIIEAYNPRTGQTVQGPLVDLGPGKGPQSRGVGLDATYGAAQQLGLTGMDEVKYRFVSAPGATGTIQPGQFGTRPTTGEQTAFELPADVRSMINTASASPAEVQLPQFQGFQMPQAGGLPPESVVNPVTGQTVPVQSEQAMRGRARTNQGGPSSLPTMGSGIQSSGSITGGTNPGQVLAQGVPQLLEKLLSPDAWSSSPVGRLFTPGENGEPSPVGSFADTIRNLFGGGNEDNILASNQAGFIDFGNDPEGTSSGTSSGNGVIRGGYDYLKSFFSNNSSSNSTGPVGVDNIDSSRS